MSRLLICGDSFAVADPNYPGLHFTEKLKLVRPEVEVLNLAMGGASNSLIELQIKQGIKFNPTHVVVTFTDPGRLEYLIKYSIFFTRTRDFNALVHHWPGQGTDIGDCTRRRLQNMATYITSVHLPSGTDDYCKKLLISEMTEPNHVIGSRDFIILKNYFTVVGVLAYLQRMRLPFCFSLGGMNHLTVKHQSVYSLLTTLLLNNNGLTDEIPEYADNMMSCNLWNYATFEYDSGPTHHVADQDVQVAFATEIINKLGV
jgi:hypothetical protein